MKLPLFQKIISEVAPLTDQVCMHLMGDPLVHPQLPEMVEICHESKVPIFLVTNGVLLREKQVQLLLHPAFRQINFSLHSFSDNYPDRDPSDYLARIIRFTEMAFKVRPDLYINYRLWNLQHPTSVAKQNQLILEALEQHFGFQCPRDLDVRNQKSVPVKNRLYLHFDTEFIWPSLDLPVLGEKGRCYGLKSHFGVLVDGTVVPCCLDKEAAIPLGNIGTQRLTDILSGARAQNLVKGFERGVLLDPLCQRCQYITRFQ